MENIKTLRWPQILLNGGENGKRILERDWSSSSLGPIEDWPLGLRLGLMTCLESRFPMGINWGHDLIHFYNDAAKPIIGGRDNFGAPMEESYSDIWHILEPMFKSVLEHGHATWVEDQLVLLNRNGFVEESYMTWSYSPLRNEGGEIQGVINSVIETTNKVIGERRLKMINKMALRTIGKSSLEEACYECIEVLKENESDAPYAVLRVLDEEKKIAKVLGSFGIEVPDRGLDNLSENFHPALNKVIKTKKPVFVEKAPVDVKVEGKKIQTPKSVYVLPLINKLKNEEEVIGFLSVGLSPQRPFDSDYKNYLDLLCNQISISVMSAKAQEEVREKIREEAFLSAKEISRGELKMLSQLLDASPDHVFMLDREGRYVYHNKATAEALKASLINLGRGDEPTLNRNGAEMSFEPKFLARFMKAKDQAFQGIVASCDVFFPSPKGVREFQCILSPMYDEDGVITKVAGITRDVTDLGQSIRIRDEFLSIASHELKTPLTTLKLQTQMRARILSKGKADVFSNEKLAKIFHDDDIQINRLNRLVDDMLDASRLTSGKIDLHLEKMDITDIIHEVLDRLSLHLESQGIEVVTNIQSIKGEWDRYRIEQVFTNLLTNAMKYGEGKPIHIETIANADQLQLIVSDQGMGIKAEDQKRIFQQFERAINSSTVSGLGLGLYIVKEIVKNHGGKITLKSEFGKGAKFIVTLPLIHKK